MGKNDLKGSNLEIGRLVLRLAAQIRIKSGPVDEHSGAQVGKEMGIGTEILFPQDSCVET